MSLYLGKIHYWLFNKIVWFEGLESEIIKLAEKKGLNVEELSAEINKKYGEKLPNKPLEEIIDLGNIHGWLQSKIHSAEGRVATWTARIIQSSKDNSNEMNDIFIHQGMNTGMLVREEKGEINTAIEIYNSINDYILDGMPCDRVNEVIISEEDLVKWQRRICVHKDIWDEVGVEVEYFYTLRDLWIKAFVTEVNSSFIYIEKDGVMEIKRV
ncbi:hypothetical protein [Clostridium sp. LP20]|uniref:hypothetical protein n=1 Tax=Clostridium sp. LP20 TaxID=3418665 RepID=UPI003EE50425